jgi:NADH-quinone oxidoreductase subunit L
MGGLRWIMPVTFLTYAIGMMNLSGVPFFFAGSWTKEEILHRTAEWPSSHLPHYLMLAGVVLTALYMTRQMIYVFFGHKRETSDAHESPRVMTMPLIILAACSFVLAIFLTPAWPWLHAYLDGEPARFDFGALIQPMLFLSLALVVGGIGLGWLMYHNAGETDPLARAKPGLFRFLGHKMWIDEFYERTFIAFSRVAARLSDFLDRYFWDGLVNLFSGMGQVFAMLSKGFDDHAINARVDDTTAGARRFGRLIAAGHSGQIQAYLGAIAIGMLLLLVLYAWLA